MDAFHIGPEWSVVNPEFAFEAFYHDCDPHIAAECIAQLRPFACAGWDLVESPAAPAWQLVPTTYAVCSQDRAIPPSDQRKMAERAGDVVELNTSHSPFLSQPRLVADMIAERIRLYSP